MSSEVIARVHALALKGMKLALKIHYLHAAESFGLAADAARALEPQRDNLVVLFMQWNEASMLGIHAGVAHKRGEDPAGMHRTNHIVRVSSVVEAYERRRVANTLFQCSDDEVAWHAVTLRGNDVVKDISDLPRMVGYTCFLVAAIGIVEIFGMWRVFKDELSELQTWLFAYFVVHAVDMLMQRLHTFNANIVDTEVKFVQQLGILADHELGGSGLDPRLAEVMTAEWQRIQQSGLLEALGVSHLFRNSDDSTKRERVTSRLNSAAASASGLRHCALASCGAREAHPQHFKRCAACRTVAYCSGEHQVADWPAHKAACKAARKAALAAAAPGGGAGTGAA